MSESFRVVAAEAEKIQVSRRPKWIWNPYYEEQRALQNEAIAICGYAEAIQQPFESVASEEDLIVRMLGSGAIEELALTEAPTLPDSLCMGYDRFHIRTHDRPDPSLLCIPPEVIRRTLCDAAFLCAGLRVQRRFQSCCDTESNRRWIAPDW